MCQLVQMRVFNSRNYLLENASGLIFIQLCVKCEPWKDTYLFPSGNVVVEFSIGSILEHNKDVAGCIDKFKVLDNVGMIELPEGLDFAANLLEDPLLFYLFAVQNLDCDFMSSQVVKGH